ncbi:YlxQ family RNA-binding protein [Virgibacillus sp. YIM 98842]|jgi:ribosomal protein L7Ae-like RNA K-turn-binding protein|uniref:YlxQ family RNA-binding protein n=1 Tax=Virgibacillus sp. YIM 98842 TaxID=2663533 RepID=UPI0013DC5886|nr:YlxQ family RNA-binding protein [Virgibacillus sp. YIM 98842]
MQNSYLNLLGLANRAGKCSTGESTIIKDIKSNKAKLVILAGDAGSRTRKRITDKCKSYDVPFEIAGDIDTLSHAIGKHKRVAVAILDAGFADKIKSLLG